MSIAISCYFRGRVFKLSKDYKHLFMPNRRLKGIDALSREEIMEYLPKNF